MIDENCASPLSWLLLNKCMSDGDVRPCERPFAFEAASVILAKFLLRLGD